MHAPKQASRRVLQVMLQLAYPWIHLEASSASVAVSKVSGRGKDAMCSCQMRMQMLPQRKRGCTQVTGELVCVGEGGGRAPRLSSKQSLIVPLVKVFEEEPFGLLDLPQPPRTVQSRARASSKAATVSPADSKFLISGAYKETCRMSATS